MEIHLKVSSRFECVSVEVFPAAPAGGSAVGYKQSAVVFTAAELRGLLEKYSVKIPSEGESVFLNVSDEDYKRLINGN